MKKEENEIVEITKKLEISGEGEIKCAENLRLSGEKVKEMEERLEKESDINKNCLVNMRLMEDS